MKLAAAFLLIAAMCQGAPAPGPQPKPEPSPSPKPNPGFLLPASQAIVTSPVVTYSQYFKSPLYHTYTPYIYNIDYAPAYSYNAYPYYVPIHII